MKRFRRIWTLYDVVKIDRPGPFCYTTAFIGNTQYSQKNKIEPWRGIFTKPEQIAGGIHAEVK